LGFVALTLREGGELWLAAASIYAVEKDPNEDFTMIKTVAEAVGVVESPGVIFDAIAQLEVNNNDRGRERHEQEFVQHVKENSIQVVGHEDDDIHLRYSDPHWKALVTDGYVAAAPDNSSPASTGARLSDLVNSPVSTPGYVVRAEKRAEESDLSDEEKGDDAAVLQVFQSSDEATLGAAAIVQGVPSMARANISASLARHVASGVLDVDESTGKKRWSLAAEGDFQIDLSGYDHSESAG
jgi:hypothetical protein